MAAKNQTQTEEPATEYLRPTGNGNGRLLPENVGTAERILSTLGGAALGWYGMKKADKAGYGIAAAAAPLLFRGITGYCPLNQAIGRNTAIDAGNLIDITETITVERPLMEVYRYWRKLENLPRFMHHLEEVRQITPTRSHWTARIPGGLGTVEWEAQIMAEDEGWLIAWQSIDDADVFNAGEVRFTELPGKGTLVQAAVSYRPPAGVLGEGVAKLLNPVFGNMIRNDMKRFKEVIESGN